MVASRGIWIVVDNAVAGAERLLRAWLEEAGFSVENLPVVGDFAWGLGARNPLGSIGCFQKVVESGTVRVVARVDLAEYSDFVEEMPDSFLYDLRLGLLLLGVDEMGVLMRPLRALNPSVPLYLDGLEKRDLVLAVAKVRQAVAYILVTFQKMTGAPILREPPLGPTH